MAVMLHNGNFQVGYKTFSPTDRGGVFTGYVHESRHTWEDRNKQINNLTTYETKKTKSLKHYTCGSNCKYLSSHLETTIHRLGGMSGNQSVAAP